ncbi:MAG: trehalose-6-phosphate synthase [Salinibacterium sp.]|nr:trehalose-6-phosphate synthase [Salinibacterium sp.]
MAKRQRAKSRPSRLVVVANRLPVRRVRRGNKHVWEPSPGGLVTAMRPILNETDGCWVGWAGMARSPGKAFTVNGMEVRDVPISASEQEHFYEGFCNATLWPLYHDAIREAEIHRHWWRAYVDVNRRFAEAAADSLRPGDTCWVHDYQLHLVPQMLRQLQPKVKIGFYLHIPFPAEELFARIPWRSELINGTLGADVIGFQTRLGVRNFVRCAQRFGDGKARGQAFQIDGRTSRVEAFPISIDTQQFESTARMPGVVERAEQIRDRMGTVSGRKLLLGIDRLDYTKGIDYRLRAVQEVLRRGTFTAEDFAVIQVAVPSRENVSDYISMRSRIEELVGNINGEYGEPGRFPIHYLRRNLPFEELIAYYGAADIMMVTPLRDGMNLVAKEYAAVRTDNSGTLILSEFAGAAQELRRAVLVNPFDVDGIANAIESSLVMPKAEASRRMRHLRAVVRSNDVYAWANSFLEVLHS